MSFMNMKAEFRREGITQAQVAKRLGMTPNNFGMKLNERVQLTVDEAKLIQKDFLPDCTLDYLLVSDSND